MERLTTNIEASFLFTVLAIGIFIGSISIYIVDTERIKDIQDKHNDEIGLIMVAYDTKLASKELQVAITQSSYDECNKRHTEPRPIVCE